MNARKYKIDICTSVYTNQYYMAMTNFTKIIGAYSATVYLNDTQEIYKYVNKMLQIIQLYKYTFL